MCCQLPLVAAEAGLAAAEAMQVDLEPVPAGPSAPDEGEFWHDSAEAAAWLEAAEEEEEEAAEFVCNEDAAAAAFADAQSWFEAIFSRGQLSPDQRATLQEAFGVGNRVMA